MSIHWLRAVQLLVLLSSFGGAQPLEGEALRKDLEALERVVYLVGLASGGRCSSRWGCSLRVGGWGR